MSEKKGTTVSEIAQEFGISSQAVRDRIKKLGINPRSLGGIFVLDMEETKRVRVSFIDNRAMFAVKGLRVPKTQNERIGNILEDELKNISKQIEGVNNRLSEIVQAIESK